MIRSIFFTVSYRCSIELLLLLSCQPLQALYICITISISYEYDLEQHSSHKKREIQKVRLQYLQCFYKSYA